MSAIRPIPIRVPAESDEPAIRTWDEVIPRAALGIMVVVFGLVFAWLSVARHEAFQSHAFDLGNMDQAVWSTLHGHLLRFTDMEVAGRVLTTRLAIHVEPLLILLAPLYLLHAGPETLLVVQAIVVSAGAVPAYLLGRALVASGWAALVFPAAYLLHPSLQNALLDDFHAVTMSACFLLWALYFAWRGPPAAFLVAAALAMSTKEEVGLLVAMLGLIWAVRRRWTVALVTVGAGLLWFVICVELIIPGNNPSGHSPYLSRYSYLGHGLSAVLLAPLRHPETVTHVLTSTSRLVYLNDLLAPVAYLAVVGLPVFLLSLPALAINMLSSDPRMYSGYYQYSAEIVPFVVAGAALGVGLLAKAASAIRGDLRGSATAALCLALLVAAGFESYEYGFSPLAKGYVVPSSGPHQALENRLLHLVPSGAVVGAADEIEPHLSQRSWVYLLPTTHPANGPSAGFIVLDASIPSLPVTPRTLHSVAARALHRGYGVAAARDGILILRRGAPARHLPRDFYTFAFGLAPTAQRTGFRWGPLELVGVVVHPHSGFVNRARPAVSVETYWRAARRLPSRVRVQLLLSPVYAGGHPRLSGEWQSTADSPTWDWLPFHSWHLHRVIHAAFVPLVPDALASGRVDVALRVEGLGRAHTAAAAARVTGDSRMVRLGTVEVGP